MTLGTRGGGGGDEFFGGRLGLKERLLTEINAPKGNFSVRPRMERMNTDMGYASNSVR